MHDISSITKAAPRISPLFISLFFFCACLSGFFFYLFLQEQDISYLYYMIALLTLGFLVSVAAFYLLLNTFNKRNRIIKNILDLIPEPVLIKNWQGKFIFCNQHLAELYNSTPEEMVGKDDYDFTGNREQAEFFKKNIQKVMRDDQPEMVYEDSTDAQTGQTRHFHSLKIPFANLFEQPNILVIARDITEITVLKNSAEKDKRRLECVLDVSQEGLWEWNTQTNEVLHNKKWELITGVENSENSFEEFKACILEEDKAIVEQALADLLKNNTPYQIEFRMKRPDGKIIWIWDRGRVVESDEEGQPIWLVGIMHDITEQKYNQQKIETLAYYDPLTKLPNRSLLDKKLNEAIEHNKTSNQYSAVLFLDLDRFKLLNDTYGHHMGDRLLIQISKRLQKVIEKRGIIARFGGDEFVAILTDLDADPYQATDQAQHLAEQLRQEVSVAIHLRSEIQELSIDYEITTSIGGVIFKSKKTTPEKLLQLADLALYQVKAEGRNDAVIFDLDMQKELHHTTALQKNMRESIDNGDFCIYLQAKYDQNQQIVGAEALVRWLHPTHGIISPVKFIGIAEEISLIIPIGNHVLHHACRELEKWQACRNTAHLTLAVNLSAKQIWQKDFVQNIIAIIHQYNIDHTKLILEITESILLHDVNDAIEKLLALKNYGLHLSLDDFGTGFSSLSYLKSLPIDEIKIDRSFVNDLIDDQQSHIMVKSIIDLGNNFHLNVVSEGVENKEQFELLKAYGITCYQGFYFSKPLNINDFTQLLANQPVKCVN